MTKTLMSRFSLDAIYPDLMVSHLPKGKLYSRQRRLPRLPVPDLDHTLEHYLYWLKPFLDLRVFQRTKKLVGHFRRNEGPLLQSRLLSLSAEEGCYNWLYLLWLESYLEGRNPLPVSTNVFYRMEHVDCPPESRQASRATALVVGVLKFYRSLLRGDLEPDAERGHPLCMSQYLNLFGSCRIPLPRQDGLSVTSLSHKRKQREIVVFRKGHLFFLPVMDRWGNPLSYPEIFGGIWELLSRDLSPGPGTGLLTTLPRDQWAGWRARMISSHPENAEIMRRMEEAPFVLCLDDQGAKDDESISWAFFLGQCENRWFDKTLQFIVLPDGEAGLNMEHSLVDGSPNARLLASIKTSPVRFRSDLGRGIPLARQMNFIIDAELARVIEHSRRTLPGLRRRVSLRVLRFNNFGRERIRNWWVSPDASIQMAIQLAQCRLFGRCQMAYEAVMTRRFLFGRTEAMRPLTGEALRFIGAMQESSPREYRVALFREACEAHVRRIEMCKEGLGVDRHLFGLLQVFRRYGEEIGLERTPNIFMDRGWKVLNHNRVSTSTTSSVGLVLAGYAPVVSNGFGLRYMTKPEAINFNITVRSLYAGLLDRMVEELEKVLMELDGLFAPGDSDAPSAFV